MESLDLTWGTKHSLRFCPTEDGLRAEMHIVKDEASQTIHLDVPPPISLHAIQSAWEKQGKQWAERLVCPGDLFAALRFLWIDVDYSLVWLVIHIHGKPHDALVFLHINEDDWPAEKKIFAAIQ